MDETNGALARQFKALGHPDRLKLLRLLSSPERFTCNLVDSRQVGICVNDLAKAAGLPQSTTSYQLGLLQAAGLVISTEHGPWRYIRANQEAFQYLASDLLGLLLGE